MSAPLRIKRHPNQVHLGEEAAAADGNRLKDYVDRLVKLVPAEILGLYLTGKGQITERFKIPPKDPVILDERHAWMILTIGCFIAAIGIRLWATSDRSKGVPPDYGAVVIACGAFLIWVYSLGDVFFRVWRIWDPLIASFLVLGWTFVSPMIYTPKS